MTCAKCLKELEPPPEDEVSICAFVDSRIQVFCEPCWIELNREYPVNPERKDEE